MQRLVAPARHGAMKYLTPAEVGQMLSLSPKTISAIALRDASMPATRIGRTLRFEEQALSRWLLSKTPRSATSKKQPEP